MEMYKITYFFKTATPGKNSFNDTLGIPADSVEDALRQWEKTATKFVLENLVYVEICMLGRDAYGRFTGNWYTIKHNTAQLSIAAFIDKHKKI
jgi:hypothetical protein